jgi:hypothetical protein
MEACLGLRPLSELDCMAHEAESNGPSEPDPELSYHQRELFAYAGKKDAAIHLLKTAIEQNYCSYSNLLSDPLLCYCDLPFLQDYVAGHHEYQSFVTTSVA